MRILGNEQKNNGQNFWEILERIIGKISSIIGTGLKYIATVSELSTVSRLTVVSREAKEEVPCDGLSTNAHEYIYKNKPC